jgi:hypothetical protein
VHILVEHLARQLSRRYTHTGSRGRKFLDFCHRVACKPKVSFSQLPALARKGKRSVKFWLGKFFEKGFHRVKIAMKHMLCPKHSNTFHGCCCAPPRQHFLLECPDKSYVYVKDKFADTVYLQRDSFPTGCARSHQNSCNIHSYPPDALYLVGNSRASLTKVCERRPHYKRAQTSPYQRFIQSILFLDEYHPGSWAYYLFWKGKIVIQYMKFV